MSTFPNEELTANTKTTILMLEKPKEVHFKRSRYGTRKTERQEKIMK